MVPLPPEGRAPWARGAGVTAARAQKKPAQAGFELWTESLRWVQPEVGRLLHAVDL